MGFPGFTPTQDNASEEEADHPTEDGADAPQVPSPHHEQAGRGTLGEGSPFVTIGGGLIALGLLAYANSRSRHHPTSRRARSHG
jgi:hypothetical protein